MTYDDRGRQHLHISFEGVVSENIYDTYGRMSQMRFYDDEAAYNDGSGTPTETWHYVYDQRGRRIATEKRDSSGSVIRSEQTTYDRRSRIIAETTPEGIIGYGYDAHGRMTHTAVFDSSSGVSPENLDLANADRVTHYAYDIMGRLISVQEDSTPSVTTDTPQVDSVYTFDLHGRMDTQTTTGQSTASVTTDYDYDEIGRLDIQTDTDQSGNILAEYDYEVRADGKRTSLDETFWFDINTDGIQQASELKSTSYHWTYDEVGRLTQEVIDHHDDTIDQTEVYTYDLTGNRVQLQRDHGNNGDGVGGFDQVISYSMDANDRLITETSDDLLDDSQDTTTTYGYDHTQQTSKQVVRSMGSQPVSSQTFTYNLQGRMASVVNETYDATGTLASTETVEYEYDTKSYRISQTVKDASGTVVSTTEYLADHHNHTGYTQTVRETKVENGHTLITDYTFGADEIAQRKHGNDATGATVDQTVIFGHDGHGSVRMTIETSGEVAQVYTFSAYGERLAIHDGLGNPLTDAEALTALQYAGEFFDALIQLNMNRARWYNAATAQWNRLDPYSGNMQDPQSLHKYAYVHGDPVMGTDPSGRSLILTGLIGIVSGLFLRSKYNTKVGVVGGIAIGVVAHLGFIQMGNINRMLIGGHTEKVNIYLTPLAAGQDSDSVFTKYRADLLTHMVDIEDQLDNINPGDTDFTIIDGELPAGSKLGYNRKEKTINIRIEWKNAKAGPIGQGANWKVNLWPNVFDSALSTGKDRGEITAPVNPDTRAMYLANMFLHETAHAVFEQDSFGQYSHWRDHTHDGVMAGFPYGKNMHFDDASQELYDYDDGTKGELRATFGSKMRWY